MDNHKTRHSFLGTASLVMGAFVLSRMLGLVRVALVGSAFGTSADADAFGAASRVTETLFTLVAGGALASAFVPTFVSYLTRGDRDGGWHVASAVINLVLLVSLVVSLVAAIAAPWIVARVLAPGYDSSTQVLTVALLRWMLASTVIFVVSGLLMGILNANDHFLLPALAPSMYNLGIILGVLLLAKRWGVYGAAIGTVIGALMHLLVQVPAVFKLDWQYKLVLGLRSAGVREVGRLMGPRVLGGAVTQLNFWVNTNLASRIPANGVVAALTQGWALMLLPQGIFAQAIGTVLLPSLSAQAARDERSEMRTTLMGAVRALLYLTLPASVGMVVLGRPLVVLFFQRGAFDAHSVAMVSWALSWYAIALVAHSELEVLTRAFYALHDTATPVWVGGGAMALNVVLSLLLRGIFDRLGPGSAVDYAPWMALGGLALANSIATILETLLLAWLLRKRLGGLDGGAFWASLWRAGLGAMAMCGALLGFQALLPDANAWVLGGGGVVLGGVVYLGATALLRSPELAVVLSAVRQRVGK